MTLVELAVALALFGLLLMGAAGAAAEAVRRTRLEAERGRALRAAQEVVDSLRAEAAPAPGLRRIGAAEVSWLVRPASPGVELRVDARVGSDTLPAVTLHALVVP